MDSREQREDTLATAWSPQPGPQLQALQCPAFEVLYGGQAGGGKTDTLLAAALRQAQSQYYKGVIFRRTYPELDEVSERAKVLIPAIFPGAEEATSRHEWRFPSGGKLLFRHMDDVKASLKHKSAEYAFIGFDELTTFEERQYRFLFTRARSSKGLAVQVMAATNPGDIGHEWVKKRWDPWLNKQSKTPAVPGEMRYFLTHPDTGEDVWVPAGTPGALSRTFIPARLEDNKVLLDADPAYRARLRAQDPLTRKQLEEGDWDAKPAPKTFFNRDWCPIVDYVPNDLRVCRGWDRAATEPNALNTDPDWTVGVKVGYSESTSLFYILDVVRLRAGPGGVKAKVKVTTQSDGVECEQALPFDPGSAGVFEAQEWRSLLIGYMVNTERETGDKLTRAKVWSAQFAPNPGEKHGRFRCLRGDWNAVYFGVIEDFPSKGVHDDDVDATSTAFRVLVNGGGGAGLRLSDLRSAGIETDQKEEDDDERDSDRDSTKSSKWGSGYRW